MQPLSAHLRIPKQAKKRRTERGDLFDYFMMVLNPDRIKSGFPPISHQRLGFLFAKVPTADLYALRSRIEDAKRRGTVEPWKVFWHEVRPKDHSPRV